MSDARQRRPQVALDVDRQGLEGADVEHPAALLALGREGLAGQLVERPEEGRQRLAGARGSATRPSPGAEVLPRQCDALAGATQIHHRFVVRNTGPWASPRETEGEAAVTGPFRRPDVITQP